MANLAYSIVVPIFNELGNVTPLHREIVAVMNQLGRPYEIIFVDDGSRDGTFEEMTALSPLTIIRFRKNFGQTAAMDAGIKAAQGDVIITMDGDGQNDPADIPKLLAKMAEGFDIVSGWRKARRDDAGKRFISRGADQLRRRFIDDGIHDSGCTLKVYRRECFAGLDLYGEMHRFIPGILKWQGFTIAELPVNHRPRTHGVTKYNWKRIVKGLIDMIAVWFWRKYSNRPLHLFGGVGILSIILGLVVGASLFIARVFFHVPIANRIWPILAVFLFLAGIQFFISGLLADIAVKHYYANNNRRSYTIRDITVNGLTGTA